ncbi:uncharacterized protein BJ171DRAFT_488305 [Polychytrium aggregatum]|uniref:uncharacterized protein n=1 Tax=Polychytrium aggregatum TaxID=110093 RepID=UPI0022FE4133|nr:uncharacterized protein BJ171DRAFT_488305 [Polychytrium aggregatum]KAI9209051.1 hypothetical protein BJ171DRAFT_488305 [Polychytrium aggregatum]
MPWPLTHPDQIYRNHPPRFIDTSLCSAQQYPVLEYDPYLVPDEYSQYLRHPGPTYPTVGASDPYYSARGDMPFWLEIPPEPVRSFERHRDREFRFGYDLPPPPHPQRASRTRHPAAESLSGPHNLPEISFAESARLARRSLRIHSRPLNQPDHKEALTTRERYMSSKVLASTKDGANIDYLPYSFQDWLKLKQRDGQMKLGGLGPNENDKWLESNKRNTRIQAYVQSLPLVTGEQHSGSGLGHRSQSISRSSHNTKG